MNVKTIILSILLLFFASIALAEDDLWGNIKHGSSFSFGNMTFYEDGVTSTQYKNMKYYSDGDYEMTIGKFTYDRKGDYSYRMGRQTFRSDGNDGMDFGNFHFYDRNKTLLKSGNQVWR